MLWNNILALKAEYNRAMRLSYVHGATDVPLIGSTIGDLLDQIAERFPDRDALISRHQKIRYTYMQFKAECERVARSLMACGVEKVIALESGHQIMLSGC